MTSKWIKAGMAAAALVLTTTLVAEAADKPVVKPVYKAPLRPAVNYYSWNGFYMGVNIGYAFGSSSWASPAGSASPKGFMLGPTFGYNVQTGNWVLGIEGDYDWTWIKGSSPCSVTSCTTRNTWLSTIRGRVGTTFDRSLIYFTGGAAFGDIYAIRDTWGSASKTATGWTVGGGLEYAMDSSTSLKVEYLYVDLGSFDCGISCASAIPATVSFKSNIVRFGLNYKLGAMPTMGPISSRY